MIDEMEIKGVDLAGRKVLVRSGVFTITCKIDHGGDYILKPSSLYVERGQWTNFIELVKSAWNDTREGIN